MLITKPEPYSIDLLNYEILESIGRKVSLLPQNRFSGKRVRQDSTKLAQMKRRAKRLNRRGLMLGMFAS